MDIKLPRCIIVRGCPGSGKSTFVNHAFKNILHLENDMFHMKDGEYKFNLRKQDAAVQWCVDTANFAFSRRMDVVISNTFTKKRYIDTYLNNAIHNGYFVSVYRMMGDFNNVHNVPTDVLENMNKNFEDYDNEIFVYPSSDDGKYFMTHFKIGDCVWLNPFEDKEIKSGTIKCFNISKDSDGDEYLEIECEDENGDLIKADVDFVKTLEVPSET